MGTRSPQHAKQSEKRGKKAAPWQMSCRVEMGRGRDRVVRQGTAALGPEELRFHTGRTGREGPDFFLHLPYRDLRVVGVDLAAGTLTVATDEHPAIVFHLGRAAAEWKARIEERPGRLDGLGIGAGARVAVVGLVDDELEDELAQRVRGYQPGVDPGTDGLDHLLVGVEHPADLARLPALARRVRSPGGIVWAIFSTGSAGSRLSEPSLVEAARNAGLAPGARVDLSRSLRALRLTRA